MHPPNQSVPCEQKKSGFASRRKSLGATIAFHTKVCCLLVLVVTAECRLPGNEFIGRYTTEDRTTHQTSHNCANILAELDCLAQLLNALWLLVVGHTSHMGKGNKS